jgi:hypothetical protein
LFSFRIIPKKIGRLYRLIRFLTFLNGHGELKISFIATENDSNLPSKTMRFGGGGGRGGASGVAGEGLHSKSGFFEEKQKQFWPVYFRLPKLSLFSTKLDHFTE